MPVPSPQLRLALAEGRPRQVLLFVSAYLRHVGVVPAALIWLYGRDKPAHRRLRDTVLATWMLALPRFWLFPGRPSRLAWLGLADTITEQTALEQDSKLAPSLYNPLAAVP